jgi:hypothetical protein
MTLDLFLLQTMFVPLLAGMKTVLKLEILV